MQKPIYIQGHWRNRRVPAQLPKINLGVVLLTATMVLMLAVYWRFTLTVAGVTSLSTFAYKYHKFLNDPSRLLVNYYGQGQVQSFYRNIKDMIWS